MTDKMAPNAIVERESFGTLFERARAELKSGNAEQAIRDSEALIKAYPDRPQGFMLKARALTSEERFEEALEALRAGLSYQVGNLKLLNMARNIALRTQGFEAALEFALKITDLAPTDIRNRSFMIQYYSASKAVELARKCADSLVQDFPHEAAPWALKVQLLLAQREKDEALSTIREAVETHPNNAKLLTLARHITSLQGLAAEAREYALKLLALAPNDYSNRAFLATIAGDFEELRLCSEVLIAEAPREPRPWMIKSDALAGQQRIIESLEAAREALRVVGRTPRLLGFARNLAFRHGRFQEALDYALELLALTPDDKKVELLATRCMMAAGKFADLRELLEHAGARALEQPLRKARRYFREFTRLERSVPAVATAWRAALDNVIVDRTVTNTEVRQQTTMIQYWSQGTPPNDVQIVLSEWQKLLHREGIGYLELFDKPSAARWISEHAPEFSELFAKAFHYAMESDVFRIAFASKRPCIYLDTDSWPLENTAEILKFAVNSQRSMLYFRAQRNWIANGFFVAAPGCPFFAELVCQTRELQLDEWPRNRLTVGKTFGPARYNKVLVDLIRKSGAWSVTSIYQVPGCSTLRLDDAEIHFSHEAAVAAVKPPFTLSYTATGEYWKRLAGK